MSKWARFRCFLFDHVPNPYSEPVMHYEVRCQRCGGIVMRDPRFGSLACRIREWTSDWWISR